MVPARDATLPPTTLLVEVGPVAFRVFPSATAHRDRMAAELVGLVRDEPSRGARVVDLAEQDLALSPRLRPPGGLVHALKQVIARELEAEGFLLFHGAALARGGEATAFIGPSGSGKSTTTLFALDRGYELLSDELVLVDTLKGRVLPAAASLGLRPAGAAFLREHCPRLVAGLGPLDALPTRLEPERFPRAAEPARLGSVFLLKPSAASASRFLFQNSLCGLVASHGGYFRRLLGFCERWPPRTLEPLVLDHAEGRARAFRLLDGLL